MTVSAARLNAFTIYLELTEARVVGLAIYPDGLDELRFPTDSVHHYAYEYLKLLGQSDVGRRDVIKFVLAWYHTGAWAALQ